MMSHCNLLFMKQILIRTCTISKYYFYIFSFGLKPLSLTMWDQFINNECNTIANIIAIKSIIIGIRLKVVSFNGIFISDISLSTKLSNSFIVNPNKHRGPCIAKLVNHIIFSCLFLQFLRYSLISSTSNKINKINN